MLRPPFRLALALLAALPLDAGAELPGAPAREVLAGAGLADVGLAQLGRENWTRDGGLAGNWVRDIVKGSDGFLWVATAGGLSRFDGRTFVNFTAVSEPEMPANSVAALAAGADGRLWIGLEHGGVRRVDHGRVQREPALDGLPPVPIRALLESSDGALWIGTEMGLWRWSPTGLERLAPSPATSAADVRRLRATADGEIWIRTAGHGIWRVRGGEMTIELDAPACEGLDLVVSTDGRLLTTCIAGVWERAPRAAEWTRVAAVRLPEALLVTRDGALWYGDRTALVRRSARGVELLPPARGLGDPRIRALFEDESGDLWVGTFASGLWRLRRGAVAAIDTPNRLSRGGTTAVLGRADGSVWVGTVDGGAYLWHRKRGLELHLDVARGLPSDQVWAIAEDPLRPGRIWFGTSQGLAELDDGRLRRVELVPGRQHEAIGLLLPDPAAPGTLWACALSGGIHELRAGRIHAFHDAGDGLAAGRIRALGRERAGTLLAGGEEGLFRFDGERWAAVLIDGEALQTVRAWAEGDDGALWVASESAGLLRVQNGQIARLEERHGLPFAGIYSLAFDRAGGLWLSGDDGLVRLRVADFDRWARGEIESVPFEVLAARDGLRDRECNGWGRPAVSSFPDGTLIYPTVVGLALLDPAALERSELSPHEIYVDRVRTELRDFDPSGLLELGREERDLRLRFGALEFLRPESVAFRYRLVGADRDWLNAGRRTEAVYSNLKPGSYAFELEARLPGQNWVGLAGPIAVTVAPKLLERTDLRLAIVALSLAAALIALGWRARIERGHVAAIAHERQLLREVIDTSPNPIFAQGRDLDYTLANWAEAAVYGTTPRDLIGRRSSEITAGLAGASKVTDLAREVLASGEERVLPEVRIVDAAGETRWFRVVERPLRDVSGEVRQVLGTAVDVTAFKLAEERLRAREAELEASREELRRLASQLIRAREEERRRLGREIHDDLTQRLVGLNLLAASLALPARRASPDTVEAKLGEIVSELGRLAADTQALSRELHPSLLENLGLEEALRAECETLGQRSGQAIGFEGRDVPEDPTSEVSLALFRIAQEALRNAVTHARATRVTVRLEGAAGGLRLTVEDDGEGFSSADLAQNTGIGLASMAERSRLIGAEYTIESRPGSGTRVEVRVPQALQPEA